MTSVDVFEQIKAAVLDLQGASYQTYERPFRALGRLLNHEDLRAINERLTEGLDYPAFLAASEATGGSMAGSHRIVWPEDPAQQLGMMLLLLKDLTSRPEHALNFSHHFFNSGRNLMSGLHSMTRDLIIPFVRDYKMYVSRHGAVKVALIREISKKIFIVHGHDGEAREATARFVSDLGLTPIILHEQASRGRTIIEKVEAHADVGFAIVLLTPDDEGRPVGGETLALRARQNVLLELGYFMARLGRENVCALRKGSVDIPSDFAGVVWTDMDRSGGWRLALGKELRAAGYDIDWNTVMG
ncbi:MAG: TIR domain-containing protein [Stenotrophomonas sp.]|uniref:TIR domain-containing protein n=1 Tax=Gammaproteobacteria TaxID=1236 RepID=UPI003D6D5850